MTNTVPKKDKCPGCNEPHSDGKCCRCGNHQHPEAKRKDLVKPS